MKYLDKFKEFLDPINDIKLLDITLSIIVAFVITLVLEIFGLNGVGIIVSALAILADLIIALFNMEYKRIAGKGITYLFILLLSVGVAKYTPVTANFVFIALLVFSFSEIVGVITRVFKK